MSDFTKISKKLGIYDNVYLRVVDLKTRKAVQEFKGHNAATSTILSGIAHFLAGDGILNQAKFTLKDFIPQYMSLGTMGLHSQNADSEGLPVGIGDRDITNTSTISDKAEAVKYYMNHLPGFGADGYSGAYNNNREYFGLGMPYDFYGDVNGDLTINATDALYINEYLDDKHPTPFDLSLADYNRDGEVNGDDSQDITEDIVDDEVKYVPRMGELISSSFPRVPITYRTIVPETDTEAPKSIDLVLGGMVSCNALEAFMGTNDYIFISEAGLWNNSFSNGNSENNGLLAGYRIFPQSIGQIDLDSADNGEIAARYPDIQKSILRVNKNQVVQIVWKIQLGGIEDIDIQRYIKYYYGPYWNEPATAFPVSVDDLLN